MAVALQQQAQMVLEIPAEQVVMVYQVQLQVLLSQEVVVAVVLLPQRAQEEAQVVQVAEVLLTLVLQVLQVETVQQIQVVVDQQVLPKEMVVVLLAEKV